MVPLNKFYTTYKSRMDAKKPYMLKFCQMRLFFLQSGGNCGGKAFERWQRDICRFLRFCRRSSLDRTCRRRCAVVVAALLVVRQLGPLRCHLSKNSKKKVKKNFAATVASKSPFLLSSLGSSCFWRSAVKSWRASSGCWNPFGCCTTFLYKYIIINIKKVVAPPVLRQDSFCESHHVQIWEVFLIRKGVGRTNNRGTKLTLWGSALPKRQKNHYQPCYRK